MPQPSVGSPSFGQRASRAFTRLLVTLLVLGLLGTVGYLLSKLNARTFTIAQEDGKLTVMKGRMLPIGAEPFRPADAFLADAYAPIPLEGQSAGRILEDRFTERDELDRALFEVLERLAHPKVASDEPKELEQGLYYLRRAEKLAGLTDEQRRSLKAMQSDVAYYQARQKLEDARRMVAESLTQLRVAAESQSRHARSANQMLSEVEPASKALEESLRKAVHNLSAPAEVPVPAEQPKAIQTDSDTKERPGALPGQPPQGVAPAAQGTPEAPKP